MSSVIKLPKGTKDCLPEDSYIWEYIENFLRNKSKIYGLKEIRTPIFEYTELFLRGVGETTDIVQKEMYTFNDKGNRSITLKAEGTAPTIRAFIEHGLHAQSLPIKLFYITPVFRYENVQKGRLRQHHQYGVELFGSESPILDAELIKIAYSVYEELGVLNNVVHINSLGCKKCRPSYNEEIKKFLHESRDNLCGICKDRLEKNPLRILDCKNENCKNVLKDAPSIIDYICDECTKHFNELKVYLNELNINFKENHHIVRGLDYYTRTVFEILDSDGFTLCGGGRYDNLVEQLGGKPMPAVGFGMGLERLILAINNNNIKVTEESTLDLFVISYSEEYVNNALSLCNRLRDLKISCDMDSLNRSLKAQMKYADKIKAKHVVVIGENEVNNKVLKIKNMYDGTVTEVSYDLEKIIDVLKSK